MFVDRVKARGEKQIMYSEISKFERDKNFFFKLKKPTFEYILVSKLGIWHASLSLLQIFR